MKNKPVLARLLLGGFVAVSALLFLIGRRPGENPLPPTGSSTLTPAVPGPVTLPPSQPDPWRERRWLNRIEQELEEGADTEEIMQMVRSRPETTAAGVSVFLPSALPAKPQAVAASAAPLPVHARHEPTIREVQMAAIRYAEVMPQKIRNWRVLSQLRNFIPRFTLGIDRDRNTTIGSSSSGGKTNFTLGPEDHSTSVDFGFTWDLANLVWDSAQTSIDSRSRLMVQLRQDILEDTTKLYFERRRLMAEFSGNPTEDPMLQKERSLRLEELTAHLDALTGGLYSEKVG